MRIDYEQPVKLAGKYRFRIKNMETGEERVTDWQDNLITDAGLARAAGGAVNSATNFAISCSVGTGLTAPSPGDTTLSAFFARQGNPNAGPVLSNTGAPDYIFGAKESWTFPTGIFNDTVLTEVGIGPFSNSSNELVSRALISPSITVASIDQLTVEWRLDIYVPQVDVTGSVDVTGGPSGINYELNASLGGGTQFCTNRVPSDSMNTSSVYYVAGGYTGCTGLGDLEQDLPTGATGTEGFNAAKGFFSYEGFDGTKATAKIRWRMRSSEGNYVGGINGMRFAAPWGRHKLYLDTPIVKDNTQELEVFTTISIQRHV